MKFNVNSSEYSLNNVQDNDEVNYTGSSDHEDIIIESSDKLKVSAQENFGSASKIYNSRMSAKVNSSSSSDIEPDGDSNTSLSNSARVKGIKIPIFRSESKNEV